MEIKPTSGRFTVYAGAYLKQDSDVHNGGGTNETALLQAILDKAEEWGGLTLEVDGAILTEQLIVHSNTTIRCANRNCGFYQADQSNRPLVRNAHPDCRVIREENIALLGGTYNFNCEHQERTDGSKPDPDAQVPAEYWMYHTNHAFSFTGVRGLTIRDLRTIDHRVFCGLFTNWEHIVIENVGIELPHNYYAQNQDGFHFWGPGRDLSIRNIRGCSGDDFMALAPDEHDFRSDITDVLIDGVYLENADQGIRMLSRGVGTLDRVTVRNVYGTYKSCGFIINPWFGVGYGDARGNFGSITLENIRLRTTEHKYAPIAWPFLFRIGGRIRSLTLKDIQAAEPNDSRKLVDISHLFGGYISKKSFVDIAELTVDGLEVLNRAGTTEPTDYISVDGKVDHLTVRNVLVNRDGHPAQDNVLHIRDGAEIGTLTVENVQGYGVERAVAVDDGAAVEKTYKHFVFCNSKKEE